MQEEIIKAYEIIKEGGIILYPTDTVWELVVMPQMLRRWPRSTN
jgi:tRNA A37 threonylcarbamoyladenosine synthetase subunit TsaC/SUA5/YrdC